MPRALIAALLLIGWPPLIVPAAASAGDPLDESNLLKAAFVYNFAKYVHWPDRDDRDDSLRLCLVGDDEIFPALGRLRGETVRGADVTIVPLPAGTDDDRCDMLFFGETERDHRLERRLGALDGRPILTISDIPRFAERGGVISLFHEEKKIRFAVNLQAARAAGLRISSRLLNLARIVDPRSDRE